VWTRVKERREVKSRPHKAVNGYEDDGNDDNGMGWG